MSEGKIYMQENGLAVGAPTLLLLAEYFILLNTPCTIYVTTIILART